MHDETFLVTKGTIRFHVPEAPGLEPKVIDAKEGDYVVVPTRAPHTFSNETDEEARFFNTFTPVGFAFQSLGFTGTSGNKSWRIVTDEINRHSTSITSSS
jgi:hypothetical protein